MAVTRRYRTNPLSRVWVQVSTDGGATWANIAAVKDAEAAFTLAADAERGSLTRYRKGA